MTHVKRLVAVLFLVACTTKDRPPDPAAKPGPRYYVVGPQPTRTLGKNPVTLLPGFGVAIVDERDQSGRRIGRTSLGRELPLRDLRPAQPSTFAGVTLDGQALDFGWVVQSNAALRAEPSPTGKVLAREPRYTRLALAARGGPEGYYQTIGGWIAATDFRVPAIAPPPAGVGPDEPWLEVDLSSQTLVAYHGRRPRFATLVSTGVGAPGTAFETPVGEHRIRAKLLASTMDNLSHTGVIPYSYEEVPFTQYLGRVALHGAFWHDQFGHRRSHGCINVSVTDAERLFAFTRPLLPEGTKEIAPASPAAATLIRVRGTPAALGDDRDP